MVTRRMASPRTRDGTLSADIVSAIGLAGPPAVAVIAFALAWSTLLPGVGYWDTAEFQAVPPLLGTLHPTGFPAYTILGWLGSVLLQPFGGPAYRMNLLSAAYVGGAAAVTAILVRQLTGRVVIAVAAGLTLFLTPLAWGIATHADAHALHVLLLGIVFALLLAWESRARDEDGPRAGADRWLIAAAAAYGVAVSNHTLAVLAAPGIGLFVLAVEPEIFGRRGLIARCIGAGVGVAALLYLELPLRAGPFRAPIVYGHPESLAGFAYVVFGQQFGGGIGSPVRELGPKLGDLADFAATQLGLLAAFVPFAALVAVVRRWRYALLTVPTLRHHLLVRRPVRQRRDHPVLPRAAAHRRDVAGDPGRRRCRCRRERGHEDPRADPWRRIPAAARRTRPGGRVRGGLRGTGRDRSGHHPPGGRREPRRRRAAVDRPGVRGAPTGRGGDQLVELLDSAMVRTRCRGSTARPHDHR